MTSGITRLHINLSHCPYFCRSAKFAANKNNNNLEPNNYATSRNLFVNSKQQSLIQIQSQADSEFENILFPVRSITLPAAPRKRSISHSPLPHTITSHPYFCDGLSFRRRPHKLLANNRSQLLSNTSQSFVKGSLPEGELPDLSIADRKKLLMNSIPHFHRSITPNESVDPDKRCESILAESITITGEKTNTSIETIPEASQISVDLPNQPCQVVECVTEDRQKRHSSGDKSKNLNPRQKLSLSRRCSEATLPLTFSLKKTHRRNKSVKKPRSKTYELIPDLEKGVPVEPTEFQEMSVSSGFESESISPTRILFRNSRSVMPRHSVYFPPSYDYSEEETDSITQLHSRDKTGYLVESSQEYLYDNTAPFSPSNRILSHGSVAEDSSYGDDVKTSHLINSGETLSPNRDSNFEITQSEHYSNTLGSQDGITVSSSIEDIICGGGDLGDSGCHFEQLANKYFSTQSVRKVILDLSQIKYVGLSLVGGADSPFGNLPVLVKEIMPGGAAERCDIARGDEIIGINSYSLEDKPLQFAVERLRHCSCRDKEIILWLIPQTD